MGAQGTGIDEQSTTDSIPEDVAALYSWANLQGAKYRDYSASRREHRAQVRYRAAKALLERELKAQGEAEASAEAAEREAAAAEARALAGAKGESQQARFAALRAAEAAALKAAADRVEAARRAEAAAHATVLALREERELSEAHVSATQQAMIYSESDALRKQLAGPQPHLPLGETPAAREPVTQAEAATPEATKSENPEPKTPELLTAPPVRVKSGGWKPLSEAILGPDQDWDSRPRPITNDQEIDTAAEQARPAWLAVPHATVQAESAPAVQEKNESDVTSAHEADSSPAAEAQTPLPDDSIAAHLDEPQTLVVAAAPHESDSLPRWLALRQVLESSARETSPLLSFRAPQVQTPLLAVFSLAGGIGATSVVASVGRALSAGGEKIVLIDTTTQALLPFYFGGKELRPGLMRTYSPPEGTGEPISLILHDATQVNGDLGAQQRLTLEIFASALGAQRMLVDLSPASSWLLRRWVDLRPAVLVPLVPSMDSVIRLETTEKLFRGISGKDGEPLLPYYVLNHFDASLPLHLDVRTVLRRRLGDRLLRFTIRDAPAVAEALADGMTVLDYAPEAGVSQEYRDVAAWLKSVSPPRPADAANVRWGEA
jgi:cellulose synthase operon protein YhjQ